MDPAIWIVPGFVLFMAGVFAAVVISAKRDAGKAVALRGSGYELVVDAARGHVSLRPDAPPAGRLLMRSRGAEGLEEVPRNIPRVQVGPDMDGLYQIWAAPSSFAERLLTAETVSRLRTLGRRGSLRLHVAPSVIHITVGGTPSDAAERRRWEEDLIAAAVAVFSSAQGSANARADEAGRCLVCGTSLESSVVACGKCATPHHRECWEFIGSCAVFGCGAATTRK